VPSHELILYSLFMVPLFLIAACMEVGLPVAMAIQSYYKNLGRQSVTCPDSKQPADVELDRSFALRTSLGGQEHSRLQACSRWPEKGDCGQECLPQVDPSPENIERLLKTWYEDKACTICEKTLAPADWRQGRLAVLDENSKLIELREMTLERFATALENMQPLCWDCHQEVHERQAGPVRELKGDRHGLAVLERTT
jgi:hypothetical protein